MPNSQGTGASAQQSVKRALIEAARDGWIDRRRIDRRCPDHRVALRLDINRHGLTWIFGLILRIR
jgi:hypothetical protein